MAVLWRRRLDADIYPPAFETMCYECSDVEEAILQLSKHREEDARFIYCAGEWGSKTLDERWMYTVPTFTVCGELNRSMLNILFEALVEVARCREIERRRAAI